MSKQNPAGDLKKRSLTRTLLLRLFLATFLVFLLTGVFLLERIYSTLYKSFDKELLAHSQALFLLSDIDEYGKFELDFSDEVIEDFSGANPRAFFVIIRLSDGAVMERSRSLQSLDLKLPVPFSDIESDEPLYWNESILGKNVRFIALRETIPIDPEDEGEEVEEETPPETSESDDEEEPILPLTDRNCLFVVGMDQQEMDAKLREIALLSTISFGAGLAFLLISGWWVVARGLQPLRVLEGEVRSISPTNLVPVTVAPVTELAEISSTLNTVIRNLKDAFERERRFTADVAHELRTPISEIRTAAEVALLYGPSQETNDGQHLKDILSSAQKMQYTVQNLLTLCRCDAGELSFQLEQVNFKPYILTLWEPYARKAEARHLRIQYDIPDDLILVTDRELLQTILLNLFSNAVDYTTPEGILEWKAGCNQERFFFRIANTVSDLSEEDLPHLCERFWQKDRVRSSDKGHNGLGLSLVCSLAEILQFSMQVKLRQPNLLQISLVSSTPAC